MIEATAWCRVDLAGGTLDIWPLGLLHPRARTVSVAVDLPVRVRLARRDAGYGVEQAGAEVAVAEAAGLLARPETALLGLVSLELALPPCQWQIESASPRGGGLGASSALAVAALRAAARLQGYPDPPPAETAAVARDLEAKLMGLPTGTQDHFAALLGGAISLSYPAGRILATPLRAVDLEGLGERLLVVYTGQSHFSAGNNWQVVRRRLDGEAEMVELFAGIAEAAAQVESALLAGDFPAVGRAMGREWSFRRQLAEGVSTPVIEDLLSRGQAAGAWGGKACGAGGGGCVALLLPPEARSALSGELEAEGFEILPARPTPLGLQVQSVVT
jgi:D-glycero-alpha-D-manno-heptose-7-phosphate kinase